mmetsp:Transcript_43696/g.83397  ORF Transcript_43696/g.83397 Transcript_43696/m.83397 type:complete len:203 (+) Transcript_43696:855-1463(+)
MCQFPSQSSWSSRDPTLASEHSVLERESGDPEHTNPGSLTPALTRKPSPAAELATTTHAHAATPQGTWPKESYTTMKRRNMPSNPRMMPHSSGARCLKPRGMPNRSPPCDLASASRVWRARSCASQSEHIMWPFCIASWAGVLPVVSDTNSASAPPPCTSSVHASEWPLMAAQCRGVHPSLSASSGRAPRHSNSRIGSAKPL